MTDETRALHEHMAPQLNAAASAETPVGAQRWAEALLSDALQNGASDVHIATQLETVHVRMRVDGVLYDVAHLPSERGRRLIRHIKTLSDMPVGTSFRPQVARRSHLLAGRSLDVRITAVPTITGEKLALRLLEVSRVQQRLDDLGLQPEQHAWLVSWLESVTGMFVVCGPTGSGKTSTLYALLHEMKLFDRSVATIEDPVEYRVEGVTQMQVDLARDFGFADGIKAMLRLDADYMLVGEMRDPASAEAGVAAAASGRAVLSTLHTRDAVGCVTTLRNWDLTDVEIASTLELVVAQRLVRRLCPQCRVQGPVDEASRRWLGLLDLPLPASSWSGAGCDHCRGLGYLGRRGVFEVWRLEEAEYELILDHAPERRIRRAMAERGHVPLLSAGLELATSAETSFAELQTLGVSHLPQAGSAAAQRITELSRVQR